MYWAEKQIVLLGLDPGRKPGTLVRALDPPLFIHELFFLNIVAVLSDGFSLL